MIDQDPSDNVTSAYLLTAAGHPSLAEGPDAEEVRTLALNWPGQPKALRQ
jgi:hypothetical protein